MPKIVRLSFDANAEELIKSLQKELEIDSKASVLARALQMLALASDNADSNGVFTYSGADGTVQKVMLI